MLLMYFFLILPMNIR